MKKIIFLSLLCLSLIRANAQEQANAIDPKVQERIKNLQIAYISDKLGLTPEQAQKFWPVYNEFSTKRNELRKELINARKEVKTAPDPQKDEELVKLGLSIRQRELNLENEYSGKLLQVITAQQILNLRKSERDFQQMIINQLQQRRGVQQRKENLRDKNQQLRQRR
jgi:hypothetical protein